MKSAIEGAIDRAEEIDYVASELLPRAAVLVRLLVEQLVGELSRTEVGLLNTLSGGPRRIPELAQLERLAQPTMPPLVQRLQHPRPVPRAHPPADSPASPLTLTQA